MELLSVDDENGRQFYEQETLRGGWSVRQLDRQIKSPFYQRTLLSKNKAAMLRNGMEPIPDGFVAPEEEIKDPLVPEFLDLKDERCQKSCCNSRQPQYGGVSFVRLFERSAA